VTDVEEHLSDGPRVVVAFASEDQLRFQWGRFLARIDVPHVLIRDSRRSWYQDGAAPYDSRSALASYIGHLTASGRLVTTLGLSAGAYAALLYGQLGACDRVIAISPVTGTRAENFDLRWHHRFSPSVSDPVVDDLARFFANGPIPYVTALVSDGPDCELDHHMAERIGIEDIRTVPGYDHGGLARGVRDDGTLEGLLR
jgi:hypothetical protein